MTAAGPSEGGTTAPATPAPSVPAFDPNSRQAAADEAQASPATEATGTSAAGPQTPAITSPATPEPGAASAAGQATSSAPTPSVPAAPSVALPAAYTTEGNSALKRSGVSAEDRNEAAVLDYHRMLNRPSEDAARGYISKEQAQWDLERRGMLPSQRDANAVKVQEYAQNNGISEREAERALTESRQLVQHERPTPPQPTGYASEAEERAARNGNNS